MGGLGHSWAVNVTHLTVQARPTAVIAETTSWPAFPQVWPRLLDEVWSAVRPRRDEICPGRNLMLYRDDVPNVEVGVEIAGSFAPVGRIVASSLPAGRVVTTTHRGSWDVGPAHQAVIDECDRLGLARLGPRWEIYGHFNAPGDEEVEIYHLVR
jgi:effector-binding domain-containing protein